jgi:hypothetical protein
MRREKRFRSFGPLWVALLGALLLVSVARADDTGWREFHSPSAGFRAEIPAEPEFQCSEERTLVGKLLHYRYIVEHPAAHFDLERFDIPAIAVILLSSRQLLERAKKGYVENLDIIVDSAEEIEVQGYPGLRLLLRRRAPESVQGETWFVLAGRHLFMVEGIPLLPEARSTMVERVFSSFRIGLDELSPCDPMQAADSHGPVVHGTGR